MFKTESHTVTIDMRVSNFHFKQTVPLTQIQTLELVSMEFISLNLCTPAGEARLQMTNIIT